MIQIERCNWAEKRARNAARILNHMLCFFLCGANDVRSYHPIPASRNRLARASDRPSGSRICAARDGEAKKYTAQWGFPEDSFSLLRKEF
jgi:hypothetical protein